MANCRARRDRRCRCARVRTTPRPRSRSDRDNRKTDCCPVRDGRRPTADCALWRPAHRRRRRDRKAMRVERVMMQTVAGTGGEGVMKSVRGTIPGALILRGAIRQLHPEQPRDEIVKAARIGRAQIDMLETPHAFAVQRCDRDALRARSEYAPRRSGRTVSQSAPLASPSAATACRKEWSGRRIVRGVALRRQRPRPSPRARPHGCRAGRRADRRPRKTAHSKRRRLHRASLWLMRTPVMSARSRADLSGSGAAIAT